MDRFYNRLTRSLLRSTTLSTASGKEGLESFFTLFAAWPQRGSPSVA